MSLASIIRGMLNIHKKIDVEKLPSQGLFYKDDFEIHIKKADIEDIIEYEYNYDSQNLGIVITKLKKIVEKNVILPSKYSYNDIKSVDIVFLFLEIVKFTNNRKIELYFFNDLINKEDSISFESSTFNYYKLDKNINDTYDSVNKFFYINGYKYSVPSIGVENSLTQFLIYKSDIPGSEVYNNYSYDFLYFLGDKSYLTFDEIENLITIFNFEMVNEEKLKIKDIVKKLSVIGKYSLKNGNQIIDVTAKIDLSTIWK
jgi:hypothetical protein